MSHLQQWITSDMKVLSDCSAARIPDHSVLQIEQFLSSLQEQEKSKGSLACRGPFLAQIKFEKLILEGILQDTRQGQILLKYMSCF